MSYGFEALQRRNIIWDPYEDVNFTGELRKALSNVLTVNNLNILNPLQTEMTHFNRNNFPINDPPIVGKTVIFMTRPDLHFQSRLNISRVGFFEYLYRSKLGRNIMHSLMTPDRGSYVGSIENGHNKSIESSDIIRSPFMPLVSNLCVNTSGAKDIVLDIHETQGDFSGNKLGYAKGGDESFNTNAEITLTFHDVRNSPVMLTFLAWMTYMHYLTKNVVTATYENRIEKIVDYTSSIYIMMLDRDQTRILRLIRYVGCFPRSLSYGAVQHSSDPNQDALRDVEVTIYANGYEPFNPMGFSEFNLISNQFLVSPAQTGMYNFREGGYSRRSPKSMPDIQHKDIGASSDIITYHNDNNYHGHPYIINLGESEHALIYT